MTPDQELRALEADLLAQAAQVHAATAAMATTLARFNELGGWHGHGIRSLGHWADINLGIPARAANRLAAAATRLGSLPVLAAAFAEGALSLDKVLLVADVATPESDARFTDMARAASAAQLHRICTAYRRVTADEAPEAFDARHRQRGVTVTPIESGLVRIVALLEADEAAIVLAALDARVEDTWRQSRHAPDDLAPPPNRTERRADALVELATDGLVTGPDPVVRGERIEVRVHVDHDVLTGDRPDGRCAIDGIGPVAPAIVRRLLCDARASLVTEPLAGVFVLGRSQRTVNRRQRRALHLRDGGCKFPGCTQHRFVDAHHVTPWEHNGPTDMDNLLLLCPAHHRLFHEGSYRIDVHGNGRFTFHRPDGRSLSPPALTAPPGLRPPPTGTPNATDGGASFDLALAIDCLVN